MVSLTHGLKRLHGEMEDLEDPLFLKVFRAKISNSPRYKKSSGSALPNHLC